MPRIDTYKDIAHGLLDNDENKALYNNRVLADRAYTLDWDLPPSLQKMDWILKRTIKLPFDTVEAGKAAYSTMEPNFNIVRPKATKKDELRFNEIENTSRYNFMRASKRRGALVSAFLQDIFLYGEGIAHVEHIDAHFSRYGDMNPNRRRGMAKYGDFIIRAHNPKDVRVRYADDSGIEGVLQRKIQTVAEFEAYWGKLATPITSRQGDEKYKDKKYVCVYDYMDWENRAVWANFQATNTSYADLSVDGLKILLEPHKLPFMPWVARTTTDKKGLLDSILVSDGVHPSAWELACITETLMHSESIAYASAMRFAIKSATGDYVFHYGIPGKYLDLRPGDEIIPMQPPPIDQNLAVLSDRTRTDMQLVPDIVLTGNAPAGSAFASINQLMQSGLHKFTPYREVCERLLEDIACIMTDWAKYLEKPMSSPKKTKKGAYAGKFELDVETYDYDGLEYMVELKPDMPIDRMAQIQAASQGVQALGWTRKYANEQLGENDPEELDRQMAMQVLEDTKLQGEAGIIAAEDQLEAQAILKGKQQMLAMTDDPMGEQILEQAFAAWQQMAQAPAGGGSAPLPPGEGSPPNPENAPGLEGVTSNPAAGESPPAMMVPGTGSQSQATGRDRQGNQVG